MQDSHVAEELYIDPWPWVSAQVAPEADETWSAFLLSWGPHDEDILDLGRSRTSLRAKVAVETAVEELLGDARLMVRSDDFGAITTAQRTVSLTHTRIEEPGQCRRSRSRNRSRGGGLQRHATRPPHVHTQCHESGPAGKKLHLRLSKFLIAQRS